MSVNVHDDEVVLARMRAYLGPETAYPPCERVNTTADIFTEFWVEGEAKSSSRAFQAYERFILQQEEQLQDHVTPASRTPERRSTASE